MGGEGEGAGEVWVGKRQARHLEAVVENVLMAGHILASGHVHPLYELKRQNAKSGHLEDSVWGEGWPSTRQLRVGQQQLGECGQQLDEEVAPIIAGEKVVELVAVALLL